MIRHSRKTKGRKQQSLICGKYGGFHFYKLFHYNAQQVNMQTVLEDGSTTKLTIKTQLDHR